jgi:Protein of unknown function (DUF3987)
LFSCRENKAKVLILFELRNFSGINFLKIYLMETNQSKNLNNKMFKKQESKHAEFATDENLEQEMRKRQSEKKPAPLDIFPKAIQPFLEALHSELKCERSYLMLSVLSAASSAIGSAYRVKIGSFGSQSLSLWGCLVGISSGSKSLTIGQTFNPLFKISSQLSNAYFKELEETEDYEEKRKIKRKALTIENETFESVLNTVAHNPKGMLKFEDELTSWIDGMGMYKNSAGVEKDFWIKSFNPAKDYEKSRVSSTPLVIKKDLLVVNVFGGTQPDLVHQFFHKNLLEKGFSNRILFAVPEATRLILPNYHYEMKEEVIKPYEDMLNRLYYELEMRSTFATPFLAKVSTQGITALEGWQKRKAKEFEKIRFAKDREIFAGLFGKGTQYFLKIALLLKLMHYACDKEQSLIRIDIVEDDYMFLALKVADYCFDAFMTTYDFYQKTDLIPPKVLFFADNYKRHGFDAQATIDNMKIAKRTFYYQLSKYMKEYPTAFNAKNKR